MTYSRRSPEEEPGDLDQAFLMDRMAYSGPFSAKTSASVYKALPKEVPPLLELLRSLPPAPLRDILPRAFGDLAKHPLALAALDFMFGKSPFNVALALCAFARQEALFKKHFDSRGILSLREFLRDLGMTLILWVDYTPNLYAFHGFIELLGITPDMTDMKSLSGKDPRVGFTRDVSAAMVSRAFPDFRLIPAETPPSRRQLEVTFHPQPLPLVQRGVLELYNHFFKCHAPARERSTAKERAGARRAMKLAGRRLVVACSVYTHPPSPTTKSILRFCKNLPDSSDITVVLAMRPFDKRLCARLNRVGIPAVSRDDQAIPLEEAVGRTGGKRILVLNTVGELRRLLQVADLAVIEHDHNLFEAANEGVPILFAKGGWANNYITKEPLTACGGAIQIDPEHFAGQVESSLRDRKALSKKVLAGVDAYNRVVLPAVIQMHALMVAAAALRAGDPQSVR